MNKEEFKQEITTRFKNTDSGFGNMTQREFILLQIAGNLINEISENDNFILDALQAYWVLSIKELNKGNLGDIERKNWNTIKNKSKKLIEHYTK